MDIIQTIIIFGVSVVGIAIISYTVGNVFLGIPAFGTVAGGDAATSVNFQSRAWNLTMANISLNSVSAMQLQSVSPLVIGAATIIGILMSVFVYTRMK